MTNCNIYYCIDDVLNVFIPKHFDFSLFFGPKSVSQPKNDNLWVLKFLALGGEKEQNNIYWPLYIYNNKNNTYIIYDYIITVTIQAVIQCQLNTVFTAGVAHYVGGNHERPF